MNGLIIDNFAGGGGASTGLEAAFGRPVDVAINHDEAAIAVHAANHPTTRHLCQSIMSIDPLDATEGKPVLLVWFSPDCKHHSKAKGGKPRDKNIRDLATIVPHWLERLKKATPGGRGAPLVIMLENVEEFRQWGPLDAEGMPIKERRGEEFKLWVARIKRQSYKVEWRELRACDYGAPTSRKRLFLIARRDGMPIVWPEPTHGKPGSPEVLAGTRLPWRTAAECIDWSIPCPSIFERKRDLKPATCRRIAAGVMRYVVNSARPFIVPITHTGGVRVHSVDDPLRTITTAKRGELAVASPVFVRTAHGEQDASGKRRGRGDHGVEEPFPTVTTSQDSAIVSATLVGVGGRRGQSGPLGIDVPHPTITTKADGAIAAASLVKLRNHSDGEDPAAPLGTVTSGGLHHGITAATMAMLCHGERRPGEEPRSASLDDPMSTIIAGGGKHATVSAFLHKYRPNSDGAPADRPMPTITANSFVKRGGGAPPLAITSAHLEQANTGMVGHDMREPLSTIVGKGCTQRLIETTLIEADALPAEMMERAVRTAAFLVKYYGTDGENEAAQVQSVDRPMDTITVKARFAVVTVTIDAVTFVLVDIGMRMLEPRELANAQGFPADYILAPVCWYVTDTGNRKYGPLPKSQQIAKIGNSVCPVMSEALARANCIGSAVLAAAA